MDLNKKFVQIKDENPPSRRRANKELLNLVTRGQKKDLPPPVPKQPGELTPPDPRTVRPFASDWLSLEDLKRAQPRSKGVGQYRSLWSTYSGFGTTGLQPRIPAGSPKGGEFTFKR